MLGPSSVVAQDLVRGTYDLEHGLVPTLVGMVPQGQLAIRRFDLAEGCVPRDGQDGIRAVAVVHLEIWLRSDGNLQTDFFLFRNEPRTVHN